MIEAIGFVGVGTIAAAMVGGLRTAWPDLRIHLSPRSAKISADLAALDPSIRQEGSNAAVVAASDVVVLAMLPPQLDDAVRDLTFRADQIVVSCVANVPLAEVAAAVSPARACRIVPLPTIVRREGPIVLCPALPEVQEAFGPLGDLIMVDDEEQFSAFVAGSALMSTFLALEGAVAGCMICRGAAPGDAATYVRSLFRALSETASRSGEADATALVLEHETPGGLNERVRRELQSRGWFDAPGAAFAGLAGLGRADLGPEGDPRRTPVP